MGLARYVDLIASRSRDGKAYWLLDAPIGSRGVFLSDDRRPSVEKENACSARGRGKSAGREERDE